MPEGEPAPTSARQPFPVWAVVAIAVGGVIAGIVAAMLMGSPSQTARGSAGPRSESRSVVARDVDPSLAVAAAPTPTWMGRRQATWARDGSRTITFELQAMREISAWPTTVQPLLVVRCLSRRTDVFVATGTPVSIEPHSDLHSVRLRLDDDPEDLEQWSHSPTYRELYSPNATALVRRLAQARQMRFAFTTYSGKPVAADFFIEGFDQLAALVARTCGWQLR